MTHVHAWAPHVAPLYRCVSCGTFGQRALRGGAGRRPGAIYPVWEGEQTALRRRFAEVQSVKDAQEREVALRYDRMVMSAVESGGRVPSLAEVQQQYLEVP